MIEERSFENPKFARGGALFLATVVGIGLVSWFVPVEWPFWQRLVPLAAAILLLHLAVRFLFWKYKGMPMGHWLTGR